jgi:hypothetical protein
MTYGGSSDPLSSFYYFFTICWHLLAAAGKRWYAFIPAHLRFPQTIRRSMGLANKSVVLYQSIKIGREWILRAVDEDSSHFTDGPFYISWYDGKKKQMDPVGRDSAQALRMANLKRAALAYIAAGGGVKNTNPGQNPAPGSAAEETKNSNQAQSPAGTSTEGEVKNKV